MPLILSIWETLSVVFQIGFQAIAEALGLAAVKAVVAIAAIIAGGRLVSLDVSEINMTLAVGSTFHELNLLQIH